MNIFIRTILLFISVALISSCAYDSSFSFNPLIKKQTNTTAPMTEENNPGSKFDGMVGTATVKLP